MSAISASPVVSLPLAGAQAGAVSALGGGHHAINMKKVLIWATIGAVAGTVVPVIPGGPVGGTLIGAALALLL